MEKDLVRKYKYSFINYRIAKDLSRFKTDTLKQTLTAPLIDPKISSVIIQANTVIAKEDTMIGIPLNSPEYINSTEFLLPPMDNEMLGRKTLVLDLDETLVHTSFQEIEGASIFFPVIFCFTYR